MAGEAGEKGGRGRDSGRGVSRASDVERYIWILIDI